jgi:predicted lipid-binding transport protein (Tim44 family)
MKAVERPRRQTGATSSDAASNDAANEEPPSSEVGGWVSGLVGGRTGGRAGGLSLLRVCVGGWVVCGGCVSECLR